MTLRGTFYYLVHQTIHDFTTKRCKDHEMNMKEGRHVRVILNLKYVTVLRESFLIQLQTLTLTVTIYHVYFCINHCLSLCYIIIFPPEVEKLTVTLRAARVFNGTTLLNRDCSFLQEQFKNMFSMLWYLANDEIIMTYFFKVLLFFNFMFARFAV